MPKDIKVLFAALIFTFLVIVGFSFVASKAANHPTGKVEGASVFPQNLDLGDVSYNGGVVTKEYEVTNTTDKTLKLRKIATSCMCTEAKVKMGDRETPLFGMEMTGDMNPPVNMELGVGEKAIVSVNFDPAAHGPEGIGPFERTVYLTFSDPAGVVDINFNGRVISE